jgi:hypothetical protein
MSARIGTTGNVGRTAAALGCFLLGGLSADFALAHTVRYISATGSDGNNCSQVAPCLSLQRGIDRTPAGSELIVLDSGDFGSGASINKSISISAVGVSASLGGGITIDNADATVVLRGLRLNGAGGGATGIGILNAAAVHVVDCEVQDFTGVGISANTQTDVKLFVSGVVSRNNGFDGLLFISGAGGRLTIDNSRFERNGREGLNIKSGEARIVRTVISANANRGINQLGAKTNVTLTTAVHNGLDGYHVSIGGEMTLEQSVARGNDRGIRTQGSSIVRLSDSVVTNNGTGLSVAAGATLLTRGNSTVTGNITDVSGVLTPLAGI